MVPTLAEITYIIILLLLFCPLFVSCSLFHVWLYRWLLVMNRSKRLTLHTFFSSSSSSFHLAPRSLPISPKEIAYSQTRRPIYRKVQHPPKPASGFSPLTRSLQSWLKNMYAESARLGALGSFFALPLGVFSALSAALRCVGRVSLAYSVDI